MQQYRFDLLAETLYDYLWHQFCDWYIELAKTVLNDDQVSIEQRRGTAQTLAETLEIAMRLLHPIMPFITEEIWQLIAPMANVAGVSVMTQPFPARKLTSDEQAEHAIDWLQRFINEVRNIKGEMNLSPKKAMHILLTKGSEQDDAYLNQLERWIKILTGTESIERVASDRVPDLSATGLVGSLAIHVPLADHIEVDVELSRLDKELQKLQQTITRSEDKLNNPKFVQNAPKSVVAAEHQRLHDNQMALDKLQKRYELLAQTKKTTQ
jgi:valyl-tRNA synthetase